MRTIKYLIALLSTFVAGFPVYSLEKIVIHSKNASIQLVLQNDGEGNFHYTVNYKGEEIIAPSHIGFRLNKPAISLQKFDRLSIDTSSTEESWETVWGEEKIVRNSYKAIKYSMRDRLGSGILINLYFRVYNDGVAFRYEFPAQQALAHFIVGDENTTFKMNGNHTAFWIPGDYDSNEYQYNKTRLDDINAIVAAEKEKDIALKTLYDSNAVQTPLLLKTDAGVFINIHEAALINYPVMQLQLNKTDHSFITHLVPDAVGNKAYLKTPFHTPWRTIIITDKATEVLSSRMIINCNEASVIKDQSWIKPQKFIGMWWEMHIGKANWQKADGKHGANTENVKTYIDFASKNGFDGVLVEGWNEGWEDWFGNWKENVFDFVTPYPDYDIKTLSEYAEERGVKLIMHHETSGSVTNYERYMDTAFRYMLAHDINTVKTGYVGRIIPRGEYHDGQWMVNHFERVAEKAARYKIMIEAHESVRPTGLHRTYPNWLSNEAARGNEFNNAPTLGLNPEHETILPFTRLMGGPMDYTPGFFRFRLNQYDSSRTTRVRTTLAKQLANFVIIYSPLQMAGDLPENYALYPDAFQFIRDVAVDWDETKILSAEPGDYIVMARKARNKEEWFAAAVTDENNRSVSFNFKFLEPGIRYEATIYRDGDDANWETNPTSYRIEKKKITSRSVLPVKLAKGGGAAIHIRRMQ